MPLNQDKSGVSLKQVIDRSYKRIRVMPPVVMT
jgi:hypothetical protein